jgi:YD repeat-containing protein
MATAKPAAGGPFPGKEIAMHHSTDAASDAARQVTAHRSRSVRASHFLRTAFGLVLALVLASAAVAATASYEYDALGRLTRIDSSDGKRVIYRLDAAGNRAQVSSGTLPGVPASITVPTSSTSGAYTISWGAATGTVTTYQLYEASSTSFSGQQLVHAGTARSAALSGRGNGTYYYRVRACWDTDCSAYRTGSNGVTVSPPPQPTIQVLNPSIPVYASGQLTQITTLANLNGYAATIHSFSETCALAGAVIESGAQRVRWTNSNFYLADCEPGNDQQCSASYVIRNSSTGQLHSGTASITVVAQGQSLPPGQYCP